MLPIHPKPQCDELLSSWVTRLAIENGLFSHVLFKTILNFPKPLFNRDIDKVDVSGLYELLNKHAGIKQSDLYKMKLTNYQGHLFENLPVNTLSRWVLPLGIYHRTRKHKGVMYCPLCLEEDKSKYFGVLGIFPSKVT